MNEFGIVGLLAGIGIAYLIIATAYLGFGTAGVVVIAVVAVVVAVSIIAAKLSEKMREARLEAAAAAAHAEWLAGFPRSVQHVVRRLTDPWSAVSLWSSVGLGVMPKGLEPGAHPTLEPSLNSYPPDEGVWPVPVGARIRLRMLPGHAPKQYVAKLEELTAVLDVDGVRVVEHKGQLICLDVRTRDPLEEAIPVPIPAEPVDLTKLNPGLGDDGEFWLVPLLERNWLGVGVPGAGKSGFVHSALIATAPAARDGLIVNIMMDFKFGIEAAKAKGLLHYAATSENNGARVLRWLRYEVVEKRGREMERRGLDKHVPTTDAPLYHLIIDELAELLDNPETRKELLRLLVSIMRLGRAIGVSVSAYTQLGNKAILGMLRDLFQIRIGMRMASPEQVVMTYGDHHAIERGAHNTSIPDRGTQGIAFVVDESSSQIVRVRAYYVTPEDLAAAAARYPLFDHRIAEQVEAYTSAREFEVDGAAGGEAAEKFTASRPRRTTPALPDGEVPTRLRALPSSDDSDDADVVDAVFAEADALAEAIGNELDDANGEDTA
ncbi:hypothetical protein [Nocardia sp. NPDC051832]|uniref:hypothetical protein n=1 Tax=Nocardia sp. NPDC051832 TaxID=3155673 RepID=UPI0034403194